MWRGVARCGEVRRGAARCAARLGFGFGLGLGLGLGLGFGFGFEFGFGFGVANPNPPALTRCGEVLRGVLCAIRLLKDLRLTEGLHRTWLGLGSGSGSGLGVG
jgi:hypothetical protein